MTSQQQFTYRMTFDEYLRYLAEASDLNHSADLANVISAGGRWVVNSHHSHSAAGSGDGFVYVRTAVEVGWL